MLGLPNTFMDALQCGSHAIWSENEYALFVVFYESWTLEIKEDEYMTGNDSDRPHANLGLNPRAWERAPLSAI